MAEETGCRGQYLSNQSIILIDAEQVGIDYIQTLIHEIIHVVEDRTGIDQTGLSHGVSEIISENVATALVENFKITPLKKR